jgi:hypothetical protein
VEVPVLVKDSVDNIGTAVLNAFVPRETRTRAVLTNCSGVLCPGTLTLVRCNELVFVSNAIRASTCGHRCLGLQGVESQR